ncbi:50S ribosomal protein L29 [Subtercola boreus]|uniref:Large ribosomal subunit protein uL29 n=1 Tax=Subtercola boreus TaxID=120213 RepID=A0A3E0VCF1_9MICO|nr:50S ribosomal protein L29 [Subtercola boreus]RFA07345.1 50S ribosomal protein L29 [Subtercola boreus]
MAIGSKELTPVELDTFEDSRLAEELRKAKEELFNLRFQSATGQLESHGRLRAVKRDIARIYTIVRERELGIRATPAPVEVAAVEAAPKKTRKAKAAPAEDAADADAKVDTKTIETESTEEAK